MEASCMKNYTKIYMIFFDYGIEDFIPCEICGERAVDINHIECRGMGGSKNKDNIENLMALCRECHIKFGDKKQYKSILKNIHIDFGITKLPLKQHDPFTYQILIT